MKVFIVLALVAAVSASGSEQYGYGGKRRKYEVSYSKSYTYHGQYGGKCNNDGIYYRNDASFVFCTNGNSYVQPCPPGTRNGPLDSYSYGGDYDRNDFCSVNLVDYGYGSKPRSYGYEPKKKVSYSYVEKKPVSYGYRESYGRGYGEKKEYGTKTKSYSTYDKGYDSGPRYEPHGHVHGDSYGRKDRGYGYGRKEVRSYGYKDDGYGKDRSYGYREEGHRAGGYHGDDGYGYGHRHGDGYQGDRGYGKGYERREVHRRSYHGDDQGRRHY